MAPTNAPLKTIRKSFKSFPAEFSIAPLWYWNDELVEDEIVRQMRELKQGNVTEAMIFPNGGMNQEYLSEEYFRLYRFALDEAAKLGMRMWTYDEYCWPSGIAGGLINEKYPEYLMPACRLYQYPVAEEDPREVVRYLPTGRVLALQAVNRDDGRVVDLRESMEDFALRWAAPAGAWDIKLAVVHEIQRRLDGVTAARWANSLPGYLDVMNPDAVAKYIELVYESHFRAAGEHVGKTMPGFFSDEAGIWYDFEWVGARAKFEWSWDFAGVHKRSLQYPDEPELYGICRTLPWTRDLVAKFRDRYGYDIRSRVCDFTWENEAVRPVAFDFMQLASDLFAESFSEQIGRWCGERSLLFTGHYGEGVWGGDHYRQVRPMQVPGIDLLGTVLSAKRLMALPRRAATAAHIHGRPRTLVETYALTPWTMELPEKLPPADLLTIMGANLHGPINYAYSNRSLRKHSSNSPGFYQDSAWPYQPYFAAHIARLCQMTGVGTPAVRTAVLYPTEATLSQTLVDHKSNQRINVHVRGALGMLLNGQVEADIVSDTTLSLGDLTASEGALVSDHIRYDAVVVPSVEFLGDTTLEVLAEFTRTGGTLILLYRMPLRKPDGTSLEESWREHFGLEGLEPRITRYRDEPVDEGRLVCIPDPTQWLTTSTVPRSGHVVELFDGTPSLFTLPKDSPQWVAVDLGEARDLESLAWTAEDSKTYITYRYQVQTSNDGENWETVAARETSGKVHEYEFKNVRARHVRLFMTEGGGRLFGMHNLDIRYRDPSGEVRSWTPPAFDPRGLGELLSGHRPPLLFQEGDAPCMGLALNERQLDGTTILSVFNLEPNERHVEARLQRPGAVEVWDVETGETGLGVCGQADDGFSVSFGPYEPRVFVLTDEPEGEAPLPQLDRHREPIMDLPDTWHFKPARENAFPLVAAKVTMADPEHPDKWLPMEHSTIPAALRRVPRVLFRAQFDADAVTGDEKLLFEQNIVLDLAVNGQTVGEATRAHYMDAFDLAVPIGQLLKTGRNVITGVFAPEIYERFTTADGWFREDNIQPTLDAFVLGSFSVKDGRLAEPVRTLDTRPWQEQGYPYYSGTGVYTCEFELKEGTTVAWLEAGTRNGVLEVAVNGEATGVCLRRPFLVDVTKHLRAGKNEIEIRVTNVIASLFAAHEALAPPAPTGPASSKGQRSGLETARLVKPTAEISEARVNRG
jgi:hypothetical protein